MQFRKNDNNAGKQKKQPVQEIASKQSSRCPVCGLFIGINHETHDEETNFIAQKAVAAVLEENNNND